MKRKEKNLFFGYNALIRKEQEHGMSSVKDKAFTKLKTLNENIASLLAKQQIIGKEIAENEIEKTKVMQFLEMYEDLSMDETPIEALTAITLNQKIAKYHNDNAEKNHIEPVIFLKIHEIVDLAYDFLKEHAPQSADQIVGYLEHSGKSIKGADKLTYVSAILSKSDKFVARRKHGGWFLVEQDPEPNKEESPTI
jgi:hypothetical protein